VLAAVVLAPLVLVGCSSVESVGVRRVSDTSIEVLVPDCDRGRPSREAGVRLREQEEDGRLVERSVMGQRTTTGAGGTHTVTFAEPLDRLTGYRVVAGTPDGDRSLAFYPERLSERSFLTWSDRRYPDTAVGRQALIDDLCEVSTDQTGRILLAVGAAAVAAAGLELFALLLRARRSRRPAPLA
jgi:hypothetical protein